MFKYSMTNNKREDILYNNILLLSRNKLFYTKFDLADTFQNRIHLIFMHISFLFIKIKQGKEKKTYKDFYQRIFDLIFNKIELNMREIGYGDTAINKNMKSLVKVFYSILINCENFSGKSTDEKNLFFERYIDQKTANNELLISYFDKYEAFCIDLSSDNVLKGEINFTYN